MQRLSRIQVNTKVLLPWSAEMDQKLGKLQKDPEAYFEDARRKNSKGLLRSLYSLKKNSQ